MSRTRPKRKDLIEWFNLDADKIPTVLLSELDDGYYAFGTRPSDGRYGRITIGPFSNQAELALYLSQVEGACEGEGIGIIMDGRVVAWRDVVATYDWPELDLIPEHLVG